MAIQDALSNCCDTTKSYAVSAGTFIAEKAKVGAVWVKGAAITVGNALMDLIRKIAAYAQPAFANAKEFVVNNKAAVAIAVGAAALGAILARVFCAKKPIAELSLMANRA